MILKNPSINPLSLSIEANSFVSLSLQRKLTPVASTADQSVNATNEVATAVEDTSTTTTEESNNKLKNLINQVANLIPNTNKDSSINTSNIDPVDETNR